MIKRVLVYGLNNSVGGVQQYIMNVQKALEERITFTFLLEGSNNRYEAEIAECGGSVRFFSGSGGIRQYSSELYRALKACRRDMDCIYVNISDFTHRLLVLLTLANHLKFKVVIHSHAAKLDRQLSLLRRFTHYIVEGWGRWLTRKSTRLAVSQRAGKYMYGREKYEIVPPGIELEKFSYSGEAGRRIRAKNNCEDHFVLGVVGRLVYIKNIEFAIRVFERLKVLCPDRDVSMIVVGDGELRSELESIAAALGISESVHFVGMTDHVADYYSAMDCLLGTSFSEGLPLGIVEAQASGLSCLCAEGNYPEEIVVTDLVEMLPLSVGPEVWAQKLLTKKKNRIAQNRSEDSARDKRLAAFSQSSVSDRLAEYLLA